MAGVVVATIGVYEFDLEAFLGCLDAAGVSLVIDVRQRRGVRGPQYAWANAQRLQASLADAGIAYEHAKHLAPTTELRQLQYADDDREGVGKRSRVRLGQAYTDGYLEQILDPADLTPLVDTIRSTDGLAALLCVERNAVACHRSLITDRLADDSGASVRHLAPGPGT